MQPCMARMLGALCAPHTPPASHGVSLQPSVPTASGQTQTARALRCPQHLLGAPRCPRATPGAITLQDGSSCLWWGLWALQHGWLSMGTPAWDAPLCPHAVPCPHGCNASTSHHCSPCTGSTALALSSFPGCTRAGDTEQGERGVVLTQAGRDTAGLGLQLGALAGFPSVLRGHTPPRPGPGPSPAGHRAQAPRGPVLPRTVNCNTAQGRHGTPGPWAESPPPGTEGSWTLQTPCAPWHSCTFPTFVPYRP